MITSILGTKNLTQQAYALLKHLRDNTNPGLCYWIVEDEHSLAIASQLLNLFIKIFKSKFLGYPLDPSREDFTLSLCSLFRQRSGIYVLTEQTYKDLDVLVSILAEDQEELAINQKISPTKLKEILIKLGYENDEESVFNFSGKGGVINITQGQRRFKIIFDEDKIEDIIDTKHQSQVYKYFLIPARVDILTVPEKIIIAKSDAVAFSDQLIKPSKIDHPAKIVFQTFKNQADAVNINYSFSEIFKYRRNFQKLAKDLPFFCSHDAHVCITAIDLDVIKTALKKEKIDVKKIHFVQQDGPIEGFEDKANNFVLISHAEIFGRRQVKKRRRRDDAIFITKLKINDYVVHQDHGIGRYLGLKSTEIEGHKRENILIEYAKGDLLYVPVELANKVDKYVGEAKPKLHRLSGTTWIRLSRKASQESQQFAKDLLKLYARRSLIQVDPWIIYPDADKKLHKTFVYQETPDQEQSINDVYQALTKDVPMDYLVVGDVGFGKTEVAIRAAYQAILNNKQVAVLCPTTLLAQQHYDTFSERLKVLGVTVEMLSRFTGKVGDKSVTPKIILQRLKKGTVDIVIGTHRLLSEDVDFKDIGLVIIDEEQRFGVRHKEKLKQLRSQCHILTLSATPIPRTLYFSLSGLSDISTITTPPEGRQPIETYIQEYDSEMVKKSIKEELKRGGQVFYLYNHVQTIVTAKKRLQELLGSKVKIDIVHGQMPADEMARVASEFDAGKIDVLLCTTIIENGLDLPNVNTLIVENATRFGLGQLYQIRGRIGRGSVKAYSYFFYSVQGMTGVAARRLQILEEAKELGSGFQLAMRDLEMRGMGQMLGQRQHGHIQKVGLSMYGKLLGQAVEEMETGEVEAIKPAVNINLPFDYGIPESLIKDSEERVRVYRQISQADNIDEVKEIIRKIGQPADLPQSDQDLFDNLIKILELRFLAQKSPLKSIDYQEVEKLDGRHEKQLELEFIQLGPQHVDALIPIIPDFKVVEQKIIIKDEDIVDYYGDVKKIVLAMK